MTVLMIQSQLSYKCTSVHRGDFGLMKSWVEKVLSHDVPLPNAFWRVAAILWVSHSNPMG
jgi:hypothetical protein